MFEHQTYEEIMSRMMAMLPSKLDKREGSIIYNALAPCAVELTLAYQSLDYILRETFADTASRVNLIKRCAERGLSPYPASPAEIQGVFTPTGIDLFGKRFTTSEGINYYATELLEPGVYRLNCETEGTAGNLIQGVLIPIEYIPGLETAEIGELLIPGEDEEDTEHLRRRYFDSLETQAYGGNIADYRIKTNSLPGVGGTKVFRAWRGGGTVRLVIIDSQYGNPSQALIDTVQEAMDPEQLPDAGGLGIAPICHLVTVEGVHEAPIDVAAEITYVPGHSYESAKAAIEAALDSYFLELCLDWERSDALVVRLSHIESRLLGLSQVLDIHGTTINGTGRNIMLDSCEIPARGEFHET